MKLKALTVGISALLGILPFLANAAGSECLSPFPIETYRRLAIDPSDFHSPVRSVQFCVNEGYVKVVVIEEELIKGLVVVNPGFEYDAGFTPNGLPFFKPKDALGPAQSGLLLVTSKDKKLMKVYRNSSELIDVLSQVGG